MPRHLNLYSSGDSPKFGGSSGFIFNTALVKLKLGLRDLLSGQIVTAGNGIVFIGVNFSENVTITGFSSHFLYESVMSIQHPTNDKITDMIHQRLNKSHYLF